jgi:hypothetical protein
VVLADTILTTKALRHEEKEERIKRKNLVSLCLSGKEWSVEYDRENRAGMQVRAWRGL